jgi:hypothetical protein
MAKLKYKRVPKPSDTITVSPEPIAEVIPEKIIAPERMQLLPVKTFKMPPGTPAPLKVRIIGAKGFLRAWYREIIGLELEVGLADDEGHHPLWKDITDKGAFITRLIHALDCEIVTT